MVSSNNTYLLKHIAQRKVWRGLDALVRHVTRIIFRSDPVANWQKRQ
jgi:hypothetical protein